MVVRSEDSELRVYDVLVYDVACLVVDGTFAS